MGALDLAYPLYALSEEQTTQASRTGSHVCNTATVSTKSVGEIRTRCVVMPCWTIYAIAAELTVSADCHPGDHCVSNKMLRFCWILYNITFKPAVNADCYLGTLVGIVYLQHGAALDSRHKSASVGQQSSTQEAPGKTAPIFYCVGCRK